MTKSLLAGMAVLAVLAVSAGDANAYVKRASIYTKRVAPALASLSLSSRSMAALRAKGGPLHDCVHVLFPQCSRGYGEPND